MSTTQTLPASVVSLMLSAWAVLVSFTLLRLLSIILLLVLEAEGAQTFEMADTITNVTPDVIVIADN